MCPITIGAAGVGGLVVGFVLGRLTKGGCKKNAGACKCAKKNDDRPLPQPPARQPIPAGSVEIYVGNLSYELDEAQLAKMFGEYGKVDSARVVLNRANGKSKGFGFVVMPNREEAEKAIAAYSEKEVMGRKMRVNEARNTIVE